MCGVLIAHSRDPIGLEQHLRAVDQLRSRGPDFVRYQHCNNIFIAQTVLHITGDIGYYQEDRSDFLSYNGEIYNYQDFGNYSTDTELVHQSVLTQIELFRKFEGPWAWAWTDFEHIKYASDPQGEHFLYRYQDKHLTVVSSEVRSILQYIVPRTMPLPYQNKTWTMQQETPWQGIERLDPGVMYTNHDIQQRIDSVFDWVKPGSWPSQAAAQEEFDCLWRRVCQQQRPREDFTISFSGGLDSSIILDELPDARLIAVNIVGKDPVVAQAANMLTPEQQENLEVIDVDIETWAKEYLELLQVTRMPAQSWSAVGRWIVSKHCGTRVLFSGQGADELFGGYGIYQNIHYGITRSHSPYSEYSSDRIWQKCLKSYDWDPKPATLLIDYWYQIVGSDSPQSDRIAGAWGQEYRNPFQSQSIIKFALSLPWQWRVGHYNKPLIRTRFQRRWAEEFILPKMGFAGHANDAAPYLGVVSDPNLSRIEDWREIARKTFYANSIPKSTLATLDPGSFPPTSLLGGTEIYTAR